MTILAFEFSSPHRSVAVLRTQTSGDALALSEVIDASPGRSSRPIAMTAEALRQAGVERGQIECVAVGLGPGSYTGIRAAIALAQGWQLARPVKLLGINSAECVAAQAQAEGITGKFSVVIDAQREEFYLAEWEISGAGRRQISPLRLVSRASVQEHAATGNILVGPEIRKWFPNSREVYPAAAMLARLAVARTDFVPGEKLEPIYLRETTFVKAPPPRFVPEKTA